MLAQQSRMWDTVRKLKQLGAMDEEKSEVSSIICVIFQLSLYFLVIY